MVVELPSAARDLVVSLETREIWRVGQLHGPVGVPRREGWILWALGRLVDKDGGRLDDRMGWYEVRNHDSLAEATHLCDLIRSGAVDPREAVTWTGGPPTVGEVVPTVADIHRRLRR